MSKPIVAIIGRQNVGKSTLLNRVVKKPLAIVEDLPGTTRDRVFADVSWQGVGFTLVDTGGLEPKPASRIAQVVKEQAEAAIAEAEDAGLVMTQDGAGFGHDGDGHYAYLDTEDKIGVAIELIERPKGRMPPEKIYPPVGDEP